MFGHIPHIQMVVGGGGSGVACGTGVCGELAVETAGWRFWSGTLGGMRWAGFEVAGWWMTEVCYPARYVRSPQGPAQKESYCHNYSVSFFESFDG